MEPKSSTMFEFFCTLTWFTPPLAIKILYQQIFMRRKEEQLGALWPLEFLFIIAQRVITGRHNAMLNCSTKQSVVCVHFHGLSFTAPPNFCTLKVQTT